MIYRTTKESNWAPVYMVSYSHSCRELLSIHVLDESCLSASGDNVQTITLPKQRTTFPAPVSHSPDDAFIIDEKTYVLVLRQRIGEMMWSKRGQPDATKQLGFFAFQSVWQALTVIAFDIKEF